MEPTHPTMAIVSAFLSGSLFTCLLYEMIRHMRDSWQKHRPPAPHLPTPDPRGEALAILEIHNWDFDAANDMIATMVSQDVDNSPFWIRVGWAIEVQKAGRETCREQLRDQFHSGFLL